MYNIEANRNNALFVSGSSTYLYIGGFDIFNNDTYYWVDTNTTVEEGFTFWRSGQPTHAVSGIPASPMAIHVADKDWADILDGNPFMYLCEDPAFSPL